MTRFVATICLSLVFLAVSQSFAHALECGKRNEVVQILKKTHKEILVAGGFTGNQMAMEVWASKNGKSWTILYTSAERISCVMAEGTAFYRMSAQPVKDPEND